MYSSDYSMLDDEVFDLDAYLNPKIDCQYVNMSMIESYYPGDEGSGPADFSYFQPSTALNEHSNKVSSPSRVTAKASIKSDRPSRPMTAAEVSELHAFFKDGPSLAKHFMTAGQRGSFSQYVLPTTGETIHCVFWDNRYFITSIDIIKVLKVLVLDEGHGHLLGNEVIDINSKKFEEVVFSVLRQLKVGVNCRLEETKSVFLEWLADNECIRTHKKQKVFYWEDVRLPMLAREISSRFVRSAESPKLGTQQFVPIPFGYPPLLPKTTNISNYQYQQVLSSGKYRGQGERKYYCEVQGCHRNFKRLEHLKRHVRTHTGERPFACPVHACGKSFSRADNLGQHLKIHEKEGLPVTDASNSESPSSMNSEQDLYYKDSGLPDLSILDYLSDNDQLALLQTLAFD